MKLIPLHDESAAIACTISDAEVPERIELFERMRSNLRGIRRGEHGLLLDFDNRPEVEHDVRLFAVDEKRCCSFWDFEVSTGDALTLRWDAPPDAAPILDRLLTWFEGDEALTTLSGLL